MSKEQPDVSPCKLIEGRGAVSLQLPSLSLQRYEDFPPVGFDFVCEVSDRRTLGLLKLGTEPGDKLQYCQ